MGSHNGPWLILSGRLWACSDALLRLGWMAGWLDWPAGPTSQPLPTLAEPASVGHKPSHAVWRCIFCWSGCNVIESIWIQGKIIVYFIPLPCYDQNSKYLVCIVFTRLISSFQQIYISRCDSDKEMFGYIVVDIYHCVGATSIITVGLGANLMRWPITCLVGQPSV